MTKLSLLRSRKGVLGVLASVFMIASLGTSPATAGELELVEEGKLTVAFNGDMPGTGWQDGKLIGLDGEIMQWIADELGLEVNPALMEWSAEIASVKSGRVDVMHGMMGWRKSRAEVMLITDPIYYFRANVTQKKGQDWCKVSDLEGKNVATITGFSWIPELKTINGLKLKLYDTSDAAIRDLLSGRVDALLADPPLIQFAIAKNPDWPIHALAFCEGENPDFPQLTKPGNIVFAMNSDSKNLHDAVNAKIAELWKDCTNREIAKKYGLTQDHWFDPGVSNQRAGVDRPDDWVQPSCK